MRIETLTLGDFRNYPQLVLELDPGANFFVGPNGAGKTNLLEAIRVGANGRSHRGAQDADLVRWGASSYRIRIQAAATNGRVDLAVTWQAATGKRASLDRVPLPRLADILGRVPVVMFSPQDLDLVQAGPQLRRRFLDLLLCQLRPAYYDAWLGYQRILSQRNRLLRASGGTPSPAELAIWDEQLVAAGVRLIDARAGLIIRLGRLLPGLHSRIAAAPEHLEVEYVPGLPLAAGADPAAAFRRHLARTLSVDRRRGLTLAGPHRDDLVLRLDGREARTVASQGQQRTAALALKLAELELLRQENEEPVLLLDDVLSELDPDRRRALLEVLSGPGQTLITTAARDGVPPDGACVYRVGGGGVVRIPA